MNTKVNNTESITNFQEKIDDKLFYEVDLGVKESTKKIYVDSIVYMYLHGMISKDKLGQLKFS